MEREKEALVFGSGVARDERGRERGAWGASP